MGEKGTRGKDLFCLLEGATRSNSQETATEHIWISRVRLVDGLSRNSQICCYRCVEPFVAEVNACTTRYVNRFRGTLSNAV